MGAYGIAAVCIAGLAAGLLLGGCAASVPRDRGGESMSDAGSAEAGTFTTDGTVRYLSLEGGFYAVVGEDGAVYDPINLPLRFKQEGMKVRMTARKRSDLAGVHMRGEIVEIVRIVRAGEQR